jgi:hypothetical protein
MTIPKSIRWAGGREERDWSAIAFAGGQPASNSGLVVRSPPTGPAGCLLRIRNHHRSREDTGKPKQNRIQFERTWRLERTHWSPGPPPPASQPARRTRRISSTGVGVTSSRRCVFGGRRPCGELVANQSSVGEQSSDKGCRITTSYRHPRLCRSQVGRQKRSNLAGS